jgi:type I restriction enzyme S subunit
MTLSGRTHNSLPPHWVTCPIADVTLPVTKIDSRDDPDKVIRYIDISGIDNTRNVVRDTKTYRLGDAPSRAKQIVRSGDVIFATVRPYLRNIAAVPPSYDREIASTGFAVLRPAPGVNPAFLFYLATSADFVNALSGLQYGVSYPAVTDDQVRARLIPLPPTREQARIVTKIEELFSELDNARVNLTTARQQLAVYRHAVLSKAFVGGFTADWREARPRETQPPDPTPRTRLPSLPAGWSYHRLGTLIDQPRYGTSKKCDYEFDGRGVLRIPNIANGVIDASDLKGACFDDEELATFALKRGDVLVIRSNGSVSLVGKCALISEADEKYLYAGYLIRLRTDSTRLLPEYLALLLSSHFVRLQIEALAKSTSGVNNISAKEIQSLLVPLCSRSEQQVVIERLSEKLSIVDALIASVEQDLRRGDILRQAILRKAFAGQLVEQNPDDEPASVLLERIARENGRAEQENGMRKARRRRRVGT